MITNFFTKFIDNYGFYSSGQERIPDYSYIASEELTGYKTRLNDRSIH